MENNELVIDRQKKIEVFTESLYKNADGIDIVGDGKNLVYETADMKITHDFADGVYIRRMNMGKNCVVVGAIHIYLQIIALYQMDIVSTLGEVVHTIPMICNLP